MSIHQKIIGFIYFVLGGVLFLLVGATALRNLHDMGMLQLLINVIFIPTLFLMSLAGLNLLRNKIWAFKLCLPTSLIGMVLLFPLGTILGIYYLWFYNQYVKHKT
ncbi:hypothetical protein [Alkalimonas mucilaginosa]|uniref:Uncharacterized protein n=1 Tax=Alkalimonas mucilaginosa TaxID=3057676 RepID=A0ABU7JC37_9GAMM|nr:hypothetical protein [Alkalimonas sp. MEB004]MEE2023045.1 hypothetical protein [Alkalimonas sp. MEB004]